MDADDSLTVRELFDALTDFQQRFEGAVREISAVFITPEGTALTVSLSGELLTLSDDKGNTMLVPTRPA
jgi:hypothetical protein